MAKYQTSKVLWIYNHLVQQDIEQIQEAMLFLTKITQFFNFSKKILHFVYGNGITTSVWQSIHKINSDIIKENDKFFNCKLISYNLCFGNTDCHLHGEAGIDIIKSSGKGFLMTHIETPDPEKKDGNGNPVINKYIVIVSRDPFKSQELQWLYVQDPNSTVDKNICTPVFNNTGNYENDPWRKEILPPGGYHIFKC